MNPRDLNIMLIGYEGGVVAWNFQKGIIDKCFEMTLPPGATGGGSYFETVRQTLPARALLTLAVAVDRANACSDVYCVASRRTRVCRGTC